MRKQKREGIEILNSWGPKEILEKDGATTGVLFRRCSSVFDDNHRFSPSFDDSVTNLVEVDSVIIGIGQKQTSISFAAPLWPLRAGGSNATSNR